MLTEGLSGAASSKDLDVLFQLVYLTFTSPRRDSAAYLAYRDRMKGMLENRAQRPESAFQDTLQVTLACGHRRARPWSLAMLDEMDLDASYAIYRDRFADADGFTFIIAGNFHPDSIAPLVCTYLGGLPTLGRKETWKDLGIRPPKGVVEKTVRRGIEPKARVAIVFTGPFEASMKNDFLFEAMAGFLRIRLRETLREDLGGTYGVSISPSTARFPEPNYSLTVSFGCAPERTDELTEAVFGRIRELKASGPDRGDVAKVREIQRRDYEESIKQNGYWISGLMSALFTNQDPEWILQVPDWIRLLSVDAIRDMARKTLDEKRFVRVVLLPEMK
jgi:zinc protease